MWFEENAMFEIPPVKANLVEKFFIFEMTFILQIHYSPNLVSFWYDKCKFNKFNKCNILLYFFKKFSGGIKYSSLLFFIPLVAIYVHFPTSKMYLLSIFYFLLFFLTLCSSKWLASSVSFWRRKRPYWRFLSVS